jgi:hypothetical protein
MFAMKPADARKDGDCFFHADHSATARRTAQFEPTAVARYALGWLDRYIQIGQNWPSERSEIGTGVAIPG